MKTLKTAMILGLILLFGSENSIYAQDKYGADPDKCKTNLSIFYEYAKVGNYEPAIEPWNWCMQNCPSSSKNLYKYGLLMAKDRYDKAAGLMATTTKPAGVTFKKVGKKYYNPAMADKPEMAKISVEIDDLYKQRIKYFPENLGKVYSDWANDIFKSAYLEERARKEEIYEKLGLSFKEDPTGMSVKNMGKYFEIFTENFKDTQPQLVFDRYDEITEAVGLKMEGYSKKLDVIVAKESKGTALTSKDKKTKRTAEINLKALGQIEGYLDNVLTEVATCDRLVPLYRNSFEENKLDNIWLKRAVSRLNQKGCTEDPLYPKMVEAYVNAAPSSDAFVFYAGILMSQGNENKAIEYFDKAINLETDNYKKAKYYYRVAAINKRKGNKSRARNYAYKALAERPSMGSAYLLIASLYYSSANSCGTDEFSKRMVYVAAADKARKAKASDPGITSTANKYIRSYMASAPSKKLVFQEGLKSGSTFKVGCWIGETTRIP
jgi:tetratricopeptide (TPR) repeat protein